ncbi:MAG: chromosome segregation protein, partial [Parcubacteria group bacterium Athens0714_26]
QSVLAKVENLQPATQVQISDTQKRRDELLIKRSALEKEMGRLEAKLEFISVSDSTDKTAPILLQEIKDNLRKIIEEKDFNAVQISLKALLLKIDKFLLTGGKEENKEHINIEKSKNDLFVQLEEIAKELKKISEQESDSRSHLENFNTSFKKAFSEVEVKKDEITALENDKNKLLFEIERFNLKMQDLEAAVRQADRDIEDFKKDFESVAAADDLFSLERKIFKLRSEIAGIGEIDEALLKEAKETESRFNFLSGQLIDLQKAMDDLESLIKDLDLKIHNDFSLALKKINEEFNKFFELMFGGGRAKLILEKPVKEIIQPGEEKFFGENAESAVSGREEDNDDQIEMGVEIELSLPRKKIKGLDMLSGGEKSLVSIAALFALISVSPPPFLVLDEVDAALDERNTKRFAELIKDFSKETQFVVVTHNRATMESADVLYGITMEEDGVSKVLSLKMEA